MSGKSSRGTGLPDQEWLRAEQARVRAERAGYDWAYRGIGPIAGGGHARIVVEDVEFGPTERKDVRVLRELAAPQYGGFGWGYNGAGTSYAAAALLADALQLGDPDSCGLGTGAQARNDTLARLREDFCWDVLSQLDDQWRLRRGAVLRWVRGWYAEQGLADLPRAVTWLPPASPHRP
jgi:hypothetical protein